MCWNSPSQISICDINSDPFMEQILDIGDGTIAEGEEVQAPRKVVSGTIPFMDTSPYTADESTPNNPEPR